LSDLAYLGIAEAGRRFRRRELSPIELTRALLERIGQLDSRCNAFLRVTPEQAISQARQAEAELVAGRDRGPMHGIPYALKDIVDVAGLPTTCHSKVLADNVAKRDAAVVTGLRKAGAVLLGKTALHEFATGGPAIDLPWPPARNPWNLALHPGGSSSGSAAALAAGFAPAAIGTDTGGSIRNPATCCGLVGMKPTYGLVSCEGVFPLSPTLDHVGPMTRTVEDNAILLQAIAGGEADFISPMKQGVAGLRIGIVEHFYTTDAEAEPAFVRAIGAAAELLRSLGAKVEPAKLSPLPAWVECGRIIQQAEQYAVHRPWLESRPQDYCALSRSKLTAGISIDKSKYESAMRERLTLRAELDALLREFDALITLSGFHLPCRVDDPETIAKTYTRHARMPFNVTGTPAIAVPTGFSEDGLPLGMQIAAKGFDEAILYRIAWAYCEAARSTERRPHLDQAS